MQFLATPRKVASKFDWKKTGSVLSVDIGKHEIGMAVAPHPSSRNPIRTLPPLRLERTSLNTQTADNHQRAVTLTQKCVQHMASIVQDHQVCALLVSWPVQDEGRFGKPCGQVLHTLDSLLEESNTIVTKQRPICLWDDRHVRMQTPVENDPMFARDPLFGRSTESLKTKTIHLASKEQYQHHDCSSAAAAIVWQDFCQAHWPELEEDREVVTYDAAAAAAAREHTTTTKQPKAVEYKTFQRKEQPSRIIDEAEDYEPRVVACA